MKRALLGAWFIGAMLFGAVRAQAGTITVNSGGDAGGPCPGVACTLRQAILDAMPGDAIDFAPNLTTIDLTSAELFVNKNLTISGPGADLLTVRRSAIQGTPNFRIFNIASGNVITISGLTISNGMGSDPGGGGILNSIGSTVNVASCILSANFATASQGGGGGGGIYNPSGGTVNITSSTLSDNGGGSSAGAGGGGGVLNIGTLNITDSTLSNNHGSAVSGGSGGSGVLNYGAVTIINSTLSGNSGGRFGGGIYNSLGTATVIGCTIAGNTTGLSGGGILINFDTTVSVRNTIIATNTVGGSGNDFSGTLTSQGYNLIGSTSGTNIIGDTTGNQLNVNPMLGPLQDNGGPTFTRALLSGSTAIDRGQSSLSTTDQRGFTRPIDDPAIPNATGGDGSDIGAYEEQTLTPVPTPTPTLTPTPTPPATPSPTATLPPTPTPTPTPDLTPTPTPSSTPAAQPLNLSTRMRVSIDDQAGIGGFIITGTGPKHVLIRAIGPSITGVSGVLADPVLELHRPGGATTTNDNWRDDPAQEAAILTTGLAPSNNLEAAIDVILSPGAYTAVVRGKNNTSGIALVEVYDLSPAVLAKLGNISTRAFVGPGDRLVIAGFILGGQNGNDNIVVRGLGPSLVPAGLPNGLDNPTLELRDNNGALLAANNDWQSNSGQAAELIAAGLAPAYASESALAVTLPPGSYTALLADHYIFGIGFGLVEVYDRGAGPPVPFPSPTPPDPTPTLPPPPTTPPPPPITPTPTPTPPPGVTPSPTPSATVTPSATPTPSPITEPCIQNFDSVHAPALPTGWSGSWVTSTIDPDSPPNDAFVPNPATTSDESLFSPFMTINSASAVLAFRNNFNTEHNPPPTEVFYDGFVLEVSTDGGATYNDILNAGGVFVSGPYTGEISSLGNNPLAGRMAWSGNSGG